MGKPYWDAYWWSHSKEVQLQIKECLLGAARGETVRQDLSVRIAEDQTIIVNATFGPLREESGEITRLVGFGVDITERERSNEELRESEARYRSIIDTTNEGFSRVDENMRIVEVNDALCRMLGYTRDELLGKTPFDLVGATEYQNSTEPHNELFHDAAQAQRQEMQFRKKDGSFLDVHVSSSGYFNAKGIPSGEFSFVTDITERKEHDEQLRQALKMEAVGRLTGGVAHEFNNLLMVVLGNIELLESHLQEDDPLRSFTSSAMKAVLRGSELTQSLLAFSRKQKLESSNVDLNELVIGTQHLFQRTLGETIIIDTELAKGIWHTAADAGQIEAALLNFVLNSRDAMPQGGTITVRTSNRQMTADTAAHFDCVGPGDYVMLEVTDTGTGMTAEQIEHAFEPFYTTKKIGEGTGLGLSVAYGFAKQSGGCLEIESEPGKGTTVRLCLPRTVETAVAADSKQEKSVEVGSGRILVVEDDDDVRTLAVKQLISLGYDVTEAADGVEMLALLDGDSDFDLLFSDVILPGGMSGPEAAKEAQRKRPHLKVLLTSGHPQKHIEDLPVGGKDMVVLTKPYRKAELAEAIMAAMNAT
ncbi:MAG: PAS domain S-box protein [Proteobacteria bacterium]|nr:PAS domain S-box protein [Pseudomonadota bacterium]